MQFYSFLYYVIIFLIITLRHKTCPVVVNYNYCICIFVRVLMFWCCLVRENCNKQLWGGGGALKGHKLGLMFISWISSLESYVFSFLL